ncbi:hypothetical protein SAICODRAFT_78779 [Saitoella complicata NRRL Y-17804]|uniref:Mitochondrial distribution and morphology protein 34 n=1 Tax=Saitoella complicata (strain BCRC 22490 / CBS 7301 / JCM 7358 / NBRC 10748 / NRRL Y-17804) TaxID=698492 RepID=A0A0E9NAV1_SAICN|nr:uncharacterized protein SAICODRAFT_78779 [Saitoella complicata NRRL Y-17804]ODQ53869.1 hypothetical protein SAICODRAFT_78779 [Saitoella complicata NRRL Y-17804]GAO46923.1 hypothetical protein G7K_1141-t1 [Saitoella complicata NRRL Y-17804]
MAFKFSWPQFSAGFYEKAEDLLSTALNKGSKPAILVDKISVKELDMGTQPPELEILEIGDIAEDRFRGIFKLNYNGDASIVLQTKVQANPLNTHSRTSQPFSRVKMGAASSPLTVPMFLRLSDLKLSGIVILVFSKQKGLTIVFRNDPLESVRVSSTFDSIPAIARFLQAEIEKQLRSLFQEELPGIIHKLSLSWTSVPKAASPPLQPVKLPPIDVDSLHLDDSEDDFMLSPVAVQPAGSSTKPISLAEIDPERGLSDANLLRLRALASSQATLSVFTPAIRGAVYRSTAFASRKSTQAQPVHHHHHTLSISLPPLARPRFEEPSRALILRDAPPTPVAQTMLRPQLSRNPTSFTRKRKEQEKKRKVVKLGSRLAREESHRNLAQIQIDEEKRRFKEELDRINMERWGTQALAADA